MAKIGVWEAKNTAGEPRHFWLCVFGERGRRTRTLCIRRSLCRHVTIGTSMVIFLLFWLSFDCFWRLVHCWYTIGTVLVDMWRLVHRWSFLLFWLSFDFFDFLTIGTLYQSSKTVKTIGVLIVTGLPRLYQQCTNPQKQSKTLKRQSKQQKWLLVYQSSHVYTESAEYTKPPFWPRI